MAERTRWRWPAVALALALALVGCGGPGQGPDETVGGAPSPAASPSPSPDETPRTPTGSSELRLMTHSSFAISDEVLDEFAERHGARVRILDAGDAGSMVNQAILARDAPLADVLYGVDNTFLSRALEADIFVAHESPALVAVPAELRLDPEHRVTPIDYGDVCLNYDRAAFSGSVEPPRTLEDLADAAYRGMLVVQNPATSSPGLAFLLATVARFGDEGTTTWRDYWRGLVANDVRVVSDWSEGYYDHFSGGAGAGDRPIVVSYASSPAAEVVFADPQPDEAPTGVVEDGCFRQVEFAGILRGARDEALAAAFVDFMLGERFQADIPLNMFVFPANQNAEVPDVFADHAAAIADPIELTPDDIDAGRERWIEEWTDVVLR